MRHLKALSLLIVLAACAVEQEPALAPAPEPGTLGAPPEPEPFVTECNAGDDGIGGTGCEPEID